jgi:hypothetical protein
MTSSNASSPLAAYFEALDETDFDRAICVFAEKCVYIRQLPPLPDSPALGDMEIIEGRDNVYAFFQRRGPIPHRHSLRLSAVDGRRCFVEGVVAVSDVPGVTNLLFVASAILNDEGLILRYTGVATSLSADKAARIEDSRSSSQSLT